jgi:hypothetical protein
MVWVKKILALASWLISRPPETEGSPFGLVAYFFLEKCATEPAGRGKPLCLRKNRKWGQKKT